MESMLPTEPPSAPDSAAPWPKEQLKASLLRLAVSLAVLVALIAFVAHTGRSHLERMGHAFIDHLGYWGMGLGSLLADGFHIPCPPQFYMLVAISSDTPILPSFAVIAAGSLVGGFLGYRFAVRLARFKWLGKRLRGPQRLVHAFVGRFGYKAALIASLLPVGYPVLCYLAGLNHLPRRHFVALSLLRVPRLAIFYWLIYMGWHGLDDAG